MTTEPFTDNLSSMPRTSSRPLVDRLLDGKLAEFISERRNRGASFDDIAFDLSEQHDVRITSETLRRWAIDLGVESAPEVAAS